METIVEILFFLSTALLIPVIITLVGFVVWSLLELGGFVREARDRSQGRRAWRNFTARLYDDDPSLAAAFFSSDSFSGFVGVFSQRGREIQTNHRLLGKLLTDLEIEAAGRLARMSLGIRLGPILGLMGTLIPLGPALMGLSSGNIDQLARNLVVAFSTTVLGLFVGAVCYGIWLRRRQWYASDLADIEYLYPCFSADEEPQQHVPRNAQTPAPAHGASAAAR